MLSAWPTFHSDEEYALAFDRARARRVLVLPALFDEANKLRHFTVSVMRLLDAAGVDSFLPDLPGCNESLAPLGAQSLGGWQADVGAAVEHFGARHILALRGGALLDPGAVPSIHLAPLAGESVLKAMLRARMLADREAGQESNRAALLELGLREGLMLAGYELSPAMLAELQAAVPPADRAQIVTQADLGGGALWLRAEPSHDAAQAERLAQIVLEQLRMTRRHIEFPCEGETLVGTLDEADGAVGLLIVSGGNELRCGAFGGQAELAAQIAELGFPTWRFDRRGIGDSSGSNGGFRSSGPDLENALHVFRKLNPQMQRIVAFGNCDAATALALQSGAGCDALVLANPWIFEEDGGEKLPPPSAIKARYGAKLRRPAEWLRLLRGDVRFWNLFSGLRAIFARASEGGLNENIASGIAAFHGPVTIVLAGNDRTGQAFAASWSDSDLDMIVRSGADHAFSKATDRQWLRDQVLSALHEQARQLDMG